MKEKSIDTMNQKAVYAKIDRVLHSRVKVYAAQKNLRMSDVVEAALKFFFNKEASNDD